MSEDKQKICDRLLAALQETRDFRDLAELRFERHNDNFQTVTARFAGGYEKKINVSLDSGAAMIRDILRVVR